MSGYILLHKSLTKWEWYADVATTRMFIDLLLHANFEPKQWRGITVNRGEQVTSLTRLSQRANLTFQQTRNTLNRLQSTGEITIKSTNKYSVISIINYDDYQTNNTQTNKQTTRHSTTTKVINKINNLSNDKLEQAPAKNISKPQEDKRNVLVQHTLEEFKRVFGFYPTDRKPRWVAQHLIQRLKTVTANRLGGELTQERLKKGITKYFNWLADQDGFTGIQKLETAKLKINIFIETIPIRKEQDVIS